jgi:hypothetical protein
MYNELPFEFAMKNFAKVYNDVFINDLPGINYNYALLEIQLIEMWELSDFVVQFKHNFANHTTKHCDYLKSEEYVALLKNFIY